MIATIVILMLLGNVIRIGYKMNKDVKKEKPKNIFQYFGKWFVEPDNFMFSILGLVASIILIILVPFKQLPEFTVYNGITMNLSYVIATFIGFSAQFIFDGLMLKMKNGSKTK